jgi:hypothetical protein
MRRSSQKANEEPLCELGTILAIGLQRLLARQSSGESPESGEFSLHLSPDQSVGHSEMAGGEAA